MSDNTAGQAEPLPDGWYQVTNIRNEPVVYWVSGGCIRLGASTWHIDQLRAESKHIERVEVCDIDALAKMRQALAAAQERIAQLESQVSFAAKLANARLEVAQWQEARIAEIEAQLAERSEWEVVPPGLHYIEWGDTAMTVALDGTLLTMRALDEETYPELSIQLDPNEYRLCRRVQGGGRE